MKVELAAGIDSISGKCGNMIFKTYKRPNGKTETRAYFNPYRRTPLRTTTSLRAGTSRIRQIPRQKRSVENS